MSGVTGVGVRELQPLWAHPNPLGSFKHFGVPSELWYTTLSVEKTSACPMNNDELFLPNRECWRRVNDCQWSARQSSLENHPSFYFTVLTDTQPCKHLKHTSKQARTHTGLRYFLVHLKGLELFPISQTPANNNNSQQLILRFWPDYTVQNRWPLHTMQDPPLSIVFKFLTKHSWHCKVCLSSNQFSGTRTSTLQVRAVRAAFDTN